MKFRIQMRTLVYIFVLLSSLCGIAQPQLGMSASYTISPASALSMPGLAYTNSITITGRIINKSATTFSAGTISVMRAVKSGTYTSGVSTIYTSSITSIIPGDSITFTATDTISALYYRADGNGNTIVVWPYASGAITKDSLRSGPVYVSNSTGIAELDRHQLFIYPNPTSQTLFIRPETGRRFKEITIYDMQLKVLIRRPFEESTDIGSLPPGSYILSVSDDEGRAYSSRFTKDH